MLTAPGAQTRKLNLLLILVLVLPNLPKSVIALGVNKIHYLAQLFFEPPVAESEER